MRVVLLTLLLVIFALSGMSLPAGATSGATVTPAVASQPTSTPARPPRPAPTPTVDAARLAAGKAIYLANYCGICHTLAAAGTTGAFGPSHEHIGSIAAQRIASTAYTGAAKTAADYIRESIVAPAAYFAPGANPRHPMPPYAHLAREDVDALVYFLLQQQ
ncbi:MAG TPA: cytochrome c [Chloroflexi bacterium]|nr:cytochrome c [Chloroflexota bacterium]